jgi:hypothetical protein
MAEALNFRIGADTAAFSSGIKKAAGALAGIAAAFISVRGVVDSFNAALSFGRFADLSQQTGETAGNLAILERALDNTGAGADKAGLAIARLQKTVVDAENGVGTAEKTLQQLGLTGADLAGKLPTEQMAIVAARLKGISDPSQRAAAAMQIFGRSGAQLLPLLVNFDSEMQRSRETLGSLPEILDKNAQMFDSMGNDIAALTEKSADFAAGLWSEVMPALEGLIGSMANFDAAGFGQQLGSTLVGAFMEPLSVVEVIGKTLLVGVIEAANGLIMGFQKAVAFVAGFFIDLGTNIFPTMIDGVVGLAMKATSQFWLWMAEQAKALINSLEGIPFFDKIAGSALAGISKIETSLQKIGNDGSAVLSNFSDSVGDAMEAGANAASEINDSFFDTSGLADDIAANILKIQESGKEFSQSMREAKEEVESIKPPSLEEDGSVDGGGGGGSGGGSSTSSRATSTAGTADMRRFEFNNQRLSGRISELESQGRFGAADNARSQLERRRQADIDKQARRDVLGRENFDDAVRREARGIKDGDIAERRQKAEDDLKQKIDEARKKITGETSGENAQEKAATQSSGGGAGGGKSPLEIAVDKILVACEDIALKLPQRALAA